MATYPSDDPRNGMIPPGFGQGMQGMFGGLKRGFQGGANALNPYSNRLLGFSAGMLGTGPSGAMKGLIAGSALDRESADRKKLNEAIQGLMGDQSGEGILSGISEAERNYLLADPGTLSKVIADRMSPPSAGVQVFAGDYKIPTGYKPVDRENPDAGIERVEGFLTEKEINDLADARVRTRTIEDQLKRYEDLVGKYGMEAAPGEARAQINSVRQSIMLEMKELVGLGVLNGPDLELMNRMIWDPVVGDPRNLPDQIMTGVAGDPAVRAKSSADELRRFMKSKIDAYNQRIQGGEENDAAGDDPLGLGQ